MDSTRKIRLGVVGVGHLGSLHSKMLGEIQSVEFIGVHDLDEKKCRAIAKEFAVRPYSEYGALLDDVEAVSIATPTSTHFEIGQRALEKGVHAFIEKPLTETVEEAETLIEIAKRKKVKIQVGHIERFNPALLALEKYRLDPMFIETHRLAQFNPRGSDVPVVLDLMIHDIDIILHLVRADLRRVDAVGVSLLFEQEDMANARLEFQDGCVANVTASRVSATTMRKLRVMSEEAYVGIDFMNKVAQVYRISEELASALKRVQKGKVPTDTDMRLLPTEFYRVEEIRTTEEREPLEVELESFVRAAQGKQPPVVPGEHGLRAMRVADEVLKEIRTHTWR